MDKNSWGIRRVDQMPQKGRTILIYGQAGRGKTSLINTLKGNILLINIDCGEQVLNPNNPNNSIDVCSLVSKNLKDPSKSIQKMDEFVDWLIAQETLEWDYIIVDNISEVQDTKLASLVEMRKAIVSPDKLAYGQAGFFMLNILKKMRNLTYAGVNVIYIAWEKTDKVEDFGGEVHSEKSTMLFGQNQAKIEGLVDFVMAMRVDKKGNRFLQLDADNKYSAKKRSEPGVEYPSIIECPKDSDSTLQDFFDLIKPKEKVSV